MITHILTQRYQQEDKIFRDFFFGIQQATNNAPTAYFLICFEKITTKLEGIDITWVVGGVYVSRHQIGLDSWYFTVSAIIKNGPLLVATRW
jgi:hypothetical protein